MTNSRHSEITINKHKVAKFFIHLICLGILFVLPEVVMNISEPHHKSIPTGVYVKTAIYIFAFYINYYVIIDRCFGKSFAIWRLLGYNGILLIIASIVLHCTWIFTAGNLPIHPHPHEPIELQNKMAMPNEAIHLARSLSLLMRDLIIIILTISLSIATKLTSRYRKERRMHQEFLTIQKEEELKSLKKQLNPHFLFNSLNCIYSLIAIDQSKAQTAVHELSRLLRYVICDDTKEVSLKQEVEFIDNYVKLMKIRMGDKSPIIFNHDIDNCKNLTIAPLLFISIIENAFKYGNTGNPNHKIEISITAQNGTINCHTFNHFTPEIIKKESTGIGIFNLRQRLNLLYGDNATLEINTDAERNTYTVNLKINNFHK